MTPTFSETFIDRISIVSLRIISKTQTAVCLAITWINFYRFTAVSNSFIVFVHLSISSCPEKIKQCIQLKPPPNWAKKHACMAKIKTGLNTSKLNVETICCGINYPLQQSTSNWNHNIEKKNRLKKYYTNALARNF